MLLWVFKKSASELAGRKSEMTDRDDSLSVGKPLGPCLLLAFAQSPGFSEPTVGATRQPVKLRVQSRWES